MRERKIDEDMVRYFIWAVANYFSITTSIHADTGTPYLLDKLQYLDYTGVIGVSGNQKGAVYVSLNTDLTEHLLETYYPDLKYSNEEDKEMIRADLTGEITNTIAGNVRNYLGEGFLISVPVVFRSPGETMHLQKGIPGIAFPISWNNFNCVLVVALETSSQEQG